jgi:hypothetical protein
MDEHHLRRIRIRRGTNSQRKEVLFEEGEFVYVNDIKRLYVGDRKTYGGVSVSNNNHVENSAIRPINSDVGDLLYNKTDKATYIVDKDGKLKKIIYSSDDVYKYKIQLDELELLLLKLEKLCCNTEFALDTDDGINILVDYGDWIKVKDYAANVDVVQCKPPVISEKYLDLKSDKTYILDIQNYKSSPDIIFINNTIDTDGNTPPQDIKIVEDSVNSSKDIKILEVTDTTIKFQAILPDPKKVISLGTFIDYSIQNSCSARQKENSSITGIVYNTNIQVSTVEIGVYEEHTSAKSYTMYKVIDPISKDYPWDKNCWFIFYFNSRGFADSYYITEISKKPKLINGNWILDKKSYGEIGPVSYKGMFIFWHPKDFDLNIWNQGKGSNDWSCFPLFDPSKHVNDSNHFFTEESVKPTLTQIEECLKSKSLTVQKNYTDVYTGTAIPSFIST